MQKLEEPTSCITEPVPSRFSASGRNQLLTYLLTWLLTPLSASSCQRRTIKQHKMGSAGIQETNRFLGDYLSQGGPQFLGNRLEVAGDMILNRAPSSKAA